MTTGIGRLTMGHIYIEPKRIAVDSFWTRPNLPRDGFTKFAADEMKVVVPVDDVSDREAQLLIERQHVHSALIGLGRYRSTVGVRAVVGKN